MNTCFNCSHKLLLLGILFLSLMGQAVAQSSRSFVIKKKAEPGDAAVHYLAHKKSGLTYVLQDATTFSPDCIWISDNTFTSGGVNKNYYFYDDEDNPRFLAAPSFEAGGELALSTTMPPVNYLSNPEHQYYFYKWDGGLGRGVQYYGSCDDNPEACSACGHVWGDGQCWDVYWVSYDATSGTWKLSAKIYELSGVPSGGVYDAVDVTEHEKNITTETGGLGALTLSDAMNYPSNQTLSISATPYSYSYIPAYTSYVVDGVTHNYWGGTDHNNNTPASESSNNNNVSSYQWTISGEGKDYLSFNSGSESFESTSSSPILYYRVENTTGHKSATITVNVTYSDGSVLSRTAEVLVKTACQNPPLSSLSAEVGFEGATVSWAPTADKYKVEWRVKTPAGSWNEAVVDDLTSYSITDIDYGTEYEYTVSAYCSGNYTRPTAPYNSFTTTDEPKIVIYGAVFGGGRMANVNGKTEVVIINCDTISAVYGGNDIAGEVVHGDGSNITLGVNANDSYSTEYNAGNASSKVNIGSVYGGGNGYYIYDGNMPGPEVGSEVLTDKLFTSSVTEVSGGGSYASSGKIPTIVKTAITVTNDAVKVDSIFGGAKNAFLTANSGNGSSITINGGTIYAVFGGNNFGGGQGYGIHYIEVNGTTTNLAANITNSSSEGYGRTFGINSIFGGGNKVYGSTTQVVIKGGQSDNVFAGGNSADVYSANVTVNCNLASGSINTFGKTYSNAITSTDGSTIVVKSDYGWNGGGIYNVRTLFGGNNEAAMDNVPTVTLTSGSIGTVYGGGNAGDMMGQENTTINGEDVIYGTNVLMNSEKVLVDYIYGGCRMSNVSNSTLVLLRKGHVGTVYGGCNISGDVGSTRIYDPYPSGQTYPSTFAEQKVKGSCYVKAGGNNGDNIIVYNDLFAGSNGYYDCSQDGVHYSSDDKFDDPTGEYAGLTIPTHNETSVFVSNGATIKGNVYAGGNLASVGFDDNTGFYRGFPELIGLASVTMDGGLVEGDVYGGGNMASIYGINEIQVSGGTIQGALYGGNDKTGQVAEKTNRVLPIEYTIASDDKTSLEALGVKTYVGVSGSANVTTVYGGGNGAYIYNSIQYCGAEPSLPIQPHTFVDIHVDGRAIGSGGGQVGTVYGGGNGVTVRHGVTVFLNVQGGSNNRNHVGTIFGGNNVGDLVVVPDIRLINGQVGTVYGGCNQGAMIADENVDGINYLKTIDGYENIGSYVKLIGEYDPDGDGNTYAPSPTNAKISNAVYGGCRMNGVTRNSLVIVEGGNHSCGVYGGSDISGTISGISQVAVTGGTVGTIYGGGNGNYYYNGLNVYDATDHSALVATSSSAVTAPSCVNSKVDMLGGSATGDIFGGGLGQGTVTTTSTIVNVGPESGTTGPAVAGDVYGGSALGTVNNTEVNVLNGTVSGSVYGGGLGDSVYLNTLLSETGHTNIAAKVNGNAVVNIGQNDEGTYFGNATINGYVFGGNNNNGSPKGTSIVNIYKTAHTTGADNNTVPTTGSPLDIDDLPITWPKTSPESGSLDAYYALKGVYGGGNLAHKSSTGLATVHVWGCDNSIKYVYGGGKAADIGRIDGSGNVTVTCSTAVIIDGGHIYRVFGGGDGETPGTAANITGDASTTINGGYMHYVFGGSNTSGTIYGTKSVTVADAGSCVDPVIYNFFAGGNLAESSGDIVTTINNCNVKFGNFYGGANQAAIHGNVTTNIYGGTYINIFGGSKSADITSYNTSAGDVTVNFYGGTVTNIFGGNDYRGQISGNIVVNVEAAGSCGFSIDNVYGGGRDAAYGCADCGTAGAAVNHGNYPQVNIKHTGTYDASTSTTQYLVNYDVFGGGLGTTAHVYGNPHVNIGDGASGHIVRVGRNVFGGGSLAPVTGSTAVKVVGKTTTTVVNNVYGGGNQATVTGNTDVQIGD